MASVAHVNSSSRCVESFPGSARAAACFAITSEIARDAGRAVEESA